MRRYTPRVFQVAGRFFRERSRVEDIAQEAFLKAYTRLSSFRGDGSFEGWLLRITTSICLNELRSRKRHPELAVGDLTEDESAWIDHMMARDSSAESDMERHLVAADLADKLLRTLSPDDRLAVTLIDGEERSVSEVADMTGWSLSKVKVQAFRARRKLRKALEELLG